ncbi:MAG: hypothetical protein ORN21_02950 [Methylophilaceae bacterium]|nr:hypothetical protein [Methylophilaceae bacterium]
METIFLKNCGVMRLVFGTLLFLSLSVVAAPSNQTIGIFNFPDTPLSNWKSGADVLAKAQARLSFFGVVAAPLVAYEGPNGGLISFTWQELRYGNTLVAEGIKDTPVSPDKSWGIESANIQYEAGQLTAPELQYAILRIYGKGADNSSFFNGNGPINRAAFWMHIPVAYNDKSGLHKYLLSLYFQGSDADFSDQRNNPNAVLLAIANSLTPIKGVGLMSQDSYIKQTENSPLNEVFKLKQQIKQRIDSGDDTIKRAVIPETNPVAVPPSKTLQATGNNPAQTVEKPVAVTHPTTWVGSSMNAFQSTKPVTNPKTAKQVAAPILGDIGSIVQVGIFLKKGSNQCWYFNRDNLSAGLNTVDTNNYPALAGACVILKDILGKRSQ